MAAVSSLYECLIASEVYAGRDNPIVKVADHAAARVPGPFRPALDNARKQRPVRRVLRVKTVEALPRPMADDVYSAPNVAGATAGNARRAAWTACP
jgi:integrase/recombinase XerD